jgi:hypothetical protein
MDPATATAATSLVSAATPFVSRALGGIFGVKSAEDEERERILEAMAPYMRVAEGGTTQGQAGLAYARGRAISDLESQAARGTAQQQAGMRREAMRQGSDVQARYASQLAELRAIEQERARMGVSRGQLELANVAQREAQRKRDELSGFAEGVGGMAARMMAPGEKPKTPGTGERISEEAANRYNARQQRKREAAQTAMALARNGEEAPVQARNIVNMPETVNGRGPAVRDVGETGGPVESLAQMQAPIAGLAATAQSLAPRRPTMRIGQSEVLGNAPIPTSRIDTSPFVSLGSASGPDMGFSPISMASTPGQAVQNIFRRKGAVPKAPMPTMPTRRRAIVAPKARMATWEADDYLAGL